MFNVIYDNYCIVIINCIKNSMQADIEKMTPVDINLYKAAKIQGELFDNNNGNKIHIFRNYKKIQNILFRIL